MDKPSMSPGTRNLLRQIGDVALRNAIVANLTVRLNITDRNIIQDVCDKASASADMDELLEVVYKGFDATMQDLGDHGWHDQLSMSSEMATLVVVLLTLHMAEKIQLVDSSQFLEGMANAPYPEAGKPN